MSLHFHNFLWIPNVLESKLKLKFLYIHQSKLMMIFFTTVGMTKSKDHETGIWNDAGLKINESQLPICYLSNRMHVFHHKHSVKHMINVQYNMVYEQTNSRIKHTYNIRLASVMVINFFKRCTIFIQYRGELIHLILVSSETF